MDITMCTLKCKISARCKRHPDSGSIPDPDYQAYADFTIPVRIKKNVPCDTFHYMKLKRKKK